MFIIWQAYRDNQKLDSLALMYSSSTPLLQSEGANSQWDACTYINSIYNPRILCLLLFG